MEISVQPEDINRIVADAVAKSAIGEHVKAAVQKVLNELAQSYNNPYEQTIKSIAHKEIERVIGEQFGVAIREKAAERVRGVLTDGVMNQIVEKAVAAATRALDKGY